MKNVIFVLVFLAILLSIQSALSQTYYVLPTYLATENSGNKLFQTPSGITIKTDKSCDINDGTQARLDTDNYVLAYESIEPYVLDNEIAYEAKEVTCAVLDWMGVYKSNQIIINSNALYDATHHYLEVYNIQETDGYQSTGVIYPRAKLLLGEDGTFTIEELEL